MTPSTPDPSIANWAAQPDISARSLLVTIFGDTVLPVTHSFRMAQLFALTKVFGYSERLVRTSMYRLSSEAWFTSQREGRQSRYTATPLAVRESELASQRIYGITENDWHDTAWTLLVLDPVLGATARAEAVHHLTWHGFFQLGADLLGSPTVANADVADLCAGLPTNPVRALATGHFHQLQSLLTDGFFTQGFDIEAIELNYKQILQRYQDISRTRTETFSGIEAFAIRTMLVHDLRRIKLRFPELPASLHAPDWAGHQAHALACELYPALSEASTPVLSEILELDYPAEIPGRFVG